MKLNPLTGAVIATAVIAVAGAQSTDAGAHRAKPRRTRVVRLQPGEAVSGPRSQGRLTIANRRGTTYVSGSFSRLAPETAHTLRWDDAADGGLQFVSDARGRAKLRKTVLSSDVAAGDAHHVAVHDDSGASVLTHDDAHHAGDGSGMHGDGHMTDGDHATHHDDPTHHTDPGMHDDGHAAGTDHTTHHEDPAHGGAGMHGESGSGADGKGTDHASHHGSQSAGSSATHGGGMMKR